MVRCAVYLCSSNNKKTKQNRIITNSFFRFPKNKLMAQLWKSKCYRLDEFNMQNARVCDRHFIPTDYVHSIKEELLDGIPTRYKRIRDSAVPSLNLPVTNISEAKVFNLELKDIKQQSSISNELIEQTRNETMDSQITEPKIKIEPQCQDTTCNEKIAWLEQELTKLRKENEELRQKNKMLNRKNSKLNNDGNSLVKTEPFDEVFESLASMQKAFLLHPLY